MSTSVHRAFHELEAVYRSLEDASDGNCRACGRCCWFETARHRLFATKLEALYLVEKCGPPVSPFTLRRCGYQHGRRCRARQGRALGCRTYFCEEAGGSPGETHERALREIKAISLAHGVPIEYRELGEHFRSAEGDGAAETPCLQ